MLHFNEEYKLLLYNKCVCLLSYGYGWPLGQSASKLNVVLQTVNFETSFPKTAWP